MPGLHSTHVWQPPYTASMVTFLLITLCVLFLAVGILSRVRHTSEHGDLGEHGADCLMLANRQLPMWIAFLTLAATWIGGGYINGTAEAVYAPQLGLVWCQAPWCYALSLVLGGFIFAKPMRERGYHTMLDLFDQRYGKGVTSVLFVPALIGDLFWTAAILSALGNTLATLLNLDATTAMVVSASVVVAYTVWGGLWSVAISDVLQLSFIVFGLSLALPFAFAQSGGITATWQAYEQAFPLQSRLIPDASAWTGPQPWGWQWLDAAMLLIFGGIPWQVYFQRILACRTSSAAKWMSVCAGIVCLVVALAPIGLGMVGTCLDWNKIDAGPPPSAAAVLPHVIQYATPQVIGILGIMALLAAVMSSMDSSILSSASMFTWNIYRPWMGGDVLMHQRVLRVAVVIVGIMTTAMALTVTSVYQLWFLCADLVYVILFPQLVMALFHPRVTRLAAVSGIVVSVMLRIIVGLMDTGWAPLTWLAEQTAYWPRLTFVMVTALITISLTSWINPRRSAVSVEGS